MERSPKLDPRVNDRVQSGGRIRRVIRHDTGIGLVWFTTETQANAHNRHCSLTEWKKWSAKGTVLETNKL